MRRLHSRITYLEVLRWGFLIMLPAAIVGSVAAWPGLRTLSVFRILYVAVGVGAAIWFLLERKLPSNIHVRGFLAFLGFWLAWTLVSLTWAADKPAGVKYVVFLSMMVSLSVGTVLAVNTVRTLRIVLVMLLLIFVAAIGIGIAEAATDFRLPTSGLIGRAERFQWAVTSFFHNQNDFATYIALWLPFLLTAPFCTRRVSAVLAAAVCALLSAICLLHTGSRTNLLAFALMVPSLLLVAALRPGMSIRSRQVVQGTTILFAVGLAIYLGMRASLPVLPLPKIGVQHWRFDTLGTEMVAGTGSGASRIKQIQGGLATLWDSHLLGVGPGNAEYHLRHVPGLERDYNPHNWWMEVLVNGGVFVFVGYLLFYAALLYNLFRVAIKSRDTTLAYAATALFTALVGYTFGSLAPSSAIHFTPMWIHFGLSLAVINLCRKRQADAPP